MSLCVFQEFKEKDKESTKIKKKVQGRKNKEGKWSKYKRAREGVGIPKEYSKNKWMAKIPPTQQPNVLVGINPPHPKTLTSSYKYPLSPYQKGHLEIDSVRIIVISLLKFLDLVFISFCKHFFILMQSSHFYLYLVLVLVMTTF